MQRKALGNVFTVLSRYSILKKRKRKIKKKERNTKEPFVIDYNNFHMDEDTFEEILTLVEPHILSKGNSRPKQALAVVLEYLASGSLPKHVASTYHIKKQHIKSIIDVVCNAICIELEPCISELTKREFIKISKGFNDRWQFPNCLGVIDGKLITLKKSRNFRSDKKASHSLALFTAADWRYKFIFHDVVTYSSEGDEDIFSKAEIGKAIIGDNMCFPQFTNVGGENLPFYFIGDYAFPLCKRIIKPFDANSQLSHEDIVFNNRLKRVKRCIDNAFGILCTKWHCLKHTMFCKPDRAKKMVVACCLLHNYLLDQSPVYCSTTYADGIDADGNVTEGEFHAALSNIQNSSLFGANLTTINDKECDTGKRIRDKLKKFFNSPEGAVE